MNKRTFIEMAEKLGLNHAINKLIENGLSTESMCVVDAIDETKIAEIPETEMTKVVVWYLLTEPELSRRGIAKLSGCSRQNVQLIVSSLGIKEITSKKYNKKQSKKCSTCSNDISDQNSSGFCVKCKAEQNVITLTCMDCGTEFVRHAAMIRYNRIRYGNENFHCSRKCLLQYARNIKVKNRSISNNSNNSHDSVN